MSLSIEIKLKCKINKYIILIEKLVLTWMVITES